jgi:hypothetical protein
MNGHNSPGIDFRINWPGQALTFYRYVEDLPAPEKVVIIVEP